MLIPICRDIPFDLDTPVAAFAKLRRGLFSFLLESAPAGTDAESRFSYLGTDPRAAWRLLDGVIHEWNPDRGWHAERRPEDPLADLEDMLARDRAEAHPELVTACGGFWGGAVGFLGYDAGRHVEKISHAPPQTLDVPDAVFVLPRVLVVVDHLRSRASLVASTAVLEGASLASVRRLEQAAQRDLDDVHRRLMSPTPLQPLRVPAEVVPAEGRSICARADFERNVQRITDAIMGGEATEVFLARRIVLEHDFETTELYRALRALSPSPYMFHLQLDGMELVGSSLEPLVGAAHGTANGGSIVEALRATVPASTMTGTPKVRAMEIIDEMEPERRGPYAGAVGYIAADAGRIALAATVRTCVVANGVASVHTGARIVHDSVPAREWDETESKARALLTAIGRARTRKTD